MRNRVIKLLISFIVSLLLFSCGNTLHNGTEMTISQVTLTGLPTSVYAEGQEMVFSYNDGVTWVHDDDRFEDATYISTVDANGDITYSFDPVLEITTPELVFLLIDPDKNWDQLQIDSSHSGKKWGDVSLDNQWTGTLNPLVIEGVVNGDSIDWGYQE